MPFNNQILGGEELVRSAIRSRNFQESPQTGWRITRNGEAFFTNVTVAEGTIIGSVFKTAETGNRVEILEENGTGFIRVYSQDGAEPGVISAGVDTATDDAQEISITSGFPPGGSPLDSADIRLTSGSVDFPAVTPTITFFAQNLSWFDDGGRAWQDITLMGGATDGGAGQSLHRARLDAFGEVYLQLDIDVSGVTSGNTIGVLPSTDFRPDLPGGTPMRLPIAGTNSVDFHAHLDIRSDLSMVLFYSGGSGGNPSWMSVHHKYPA